MAIGDDCRAELRELQEDGAEFGAKNFHGGEKFVEFGVAVVKKFVVGDASRSFDGEEKIVRSFGGPVFDGARRGAAIQSGIHFDGVEVGGVKT